MAVKNRKLITLLLAIIVFTTAGWAGCSQGEPIEISLHTTSPQIVGQIYIGGAVNNPGFYPLEAGDTIEELIQAAGGTTDGADLSQIELRIPQPGEAEEIQKININYAPAWLLEALPGIGPSKAQAIIDYREQNGGFSDIVEITKVPGIGESIYNDIKDFITVGD